MAYKLHRCTGAKTCKVCGRTSYCSYALKDGVLPEAYGDDDVALVLCYGSTSAPMGWRLCGPTKDGGGFSFAPEGYKGGTPERNPEFEKQQREEERKAEERQYRRARQEWNAASTHPQGGRNHAVLHGYLGARGIPVDRLERNGAPMVPSSLAYAPNCVDEYDPEAKAWSRSPAMVAAIQGADNKFKAIHRTFLDPADLSRKRDDGMANKKMLAKRIGGAVRLTTDHPKARPLALVLTEGIETGLAVMASCTGVHVWAALDCAGLVNIELPPWITDPANEDSVPVILIAGDLDRMRTKAEFDEAPHRRYGREGQKHASMAVTKLRVKYPWLTVEARFPSDVCLPTHVRRLTADERWYDFSPHDNGCDPIEHVKSIDWLDVLNLGGIEAVRRGVLDGIDFKAAEAKSQTYSPPQDGGGSPPAAPSSTGGDDDDGDDNRIIASSPVARAKRYLIECETPQAVRKRRTGTFYLRYHNGLWYEFDGAQWIVAEDVLVRERVRLWLDKFKVRSPGRDPRPLLANTETVNNVVASMMGLTIVPSAMMAPCWIPASFDKHGSPKWGEATRRARDGIVQPERGMWISYRNGMLDGDAWRMGELVWKQHDARYFNHNAMPYDLPIDELKKAMGADDPDAALQEVAGRLCPTWLETIGDHANDDVQWLDCIQQVFGYLKTPGNWLKKIILLHGHPNSGKGTITDVIQAVLGPGNFESTRLNILAGRWGTSQIEHCLAVILPDAHLGRWVDGVDAVEIMKSVSGGDHVPVERKNDPTIRSVLIPGKFVISVNEMLGLKDSSQALAKRMVILNFTNVYEGKNVDKTRKARCCAEAPGIAIWALAGLRNLCAGGLEHAEFTLPLSSREAIEGFKRDSSPVTAFLDDCCSSSDGSGWLAGPEHSVTCSTMFGAWAQWCDDQNQYVGNAQQLGRQLNSVVPQLETKQGTDAAGNRVRRYIGIGLNIQGNALADAHARR